eukprot:scaffold3051_cov175-Amphora_coffeaeformis.AAC.1
MVSLERTKCCLAFAVNALAVALLVGVLAHEYFDVTTTEPSSSSSFSPSSTLLNPTTEVQDSTRGISKKIVSLGDVQNGEKTKTKKMGKMKGKKNTMNTNLTGNDENSMAS